MNHDESKACIRALRYSGHPSRADLWQRDLDKLDALYESAAFVPYLLRHIEALGGDAEAALENAKLSLHLAKGETE